jgi:transposase
MKKTVFIGIDVSKATFDVTIYLASSTGKGAHRQFENKKSGFGLMITWIKEQHELKECVFCLESTGIFCYQLCYFLSAAGADYAIESAYEIKHSMGIVRGKSDKADSAMIALYAFRNQDKLRVRKLPEGKLMELKLLLTHRSQVLKHKNRLVVMAGELSQVKDKLDVTFLLSSLQKQAKAAKEQLKKVNQQIKEMLKAPELEPQANLLCSVPGVGVLIAAHMIAYSEGFTKFSCWRKFACYIGSAPFPRQSGSSIRGKTKTSPIANRKLKGLMTIGAVNMLRLDTEYRRYYQRKLREGKPHMVILNSIRNKLLSRMFSVVRRNSPYVVLQR